MKKLLSVLLALLLVFSLSLPAFAFPSSEEGDGRDETFGIAKGYVRTKESTKDADGNSYVCVTEYNKQGKPVKETITNNGEDYSYTATTKYAYDKKGNLTKETYYGSDYITVTTYTYNSKGKVTTEAVKTTYEDNSSYLSVRNYTYNKAGNVTKELAYDDDCEDLTIYTYNKAGDVTKQVQTKGYEDNTQSKITETWTYDKNRNEIKWTIVDRDRYGSTEKRARASVYNQKNLCVKMTETWSFTSSEGSIDSVREVTAYTYDSKGNVTKEVYKSTSSDGYNRSVTIVNTFDETGKLTKKAISEKTTEYSAKTATTYTYDKRGLLLKEITVSKDSDGTNKTTETYTYDKAGNLTKYVCAYRYGDGSTNKETTVYTYQKIGA